MHSVIPAQVYPRENGGRNPIKPTLDSRWHGNDDPLALSCLL